MALDKTRPNRLLGGLILLSLLIHLLLFLHVAGSYQPQAISYIELSLRPTDPPQVREIPRPRIPPITPVQVDAVKNHQISHERVDLPKIPDLMDVSGFFVPGLKMDKGMASAPASPPVNPPVNPPVSPPAPEFPTEFDTAQAYFEMLHLRIQSVKQYPEAAKSRHMEGRVHLQFVLSADGSLVDIKILKSSRHRNLDEAALEAVKKASPFPRPPAVIFTAPVTLRIDIVFELV